MQIKPSARIVETGNAAMHHAGCEKSRPTTLSSVVSKLTWQHGAHQLAKFIVELVTEKPSVFFAEVHTVHA